MLAGVLVRGLIEKEDAKLSMVIHFPTTSAHCVVSALCVSCWARRHICLALDVFLIRSSNMLAASSMRNHHSVGM